MDEVDAADFVLNRLSIRFYDEILMKRSSAISDIPDRNKN
jgi:hypothetical protein